MSATPLSSQAPSGAGRDYRPLGREIFKELVEIKSTESGVGSTPAAEAVARRLRAAGFPEGDIQVLGPVARKKNVVARLRGAGQARPILIIGHLDVVEARQEDWSPDLDPFAFTERDGFFYGRGTQDMKGAAAIVVTNFIRWKQEGWVPARDLILALTADEELYGDENGVKWLMKNHRDLIDAEFALNADGGDFETRGENRSALRLRLVKRRRQFSSSRRATGEATALSRAGTTRSTSSWPRSLASRSFGSPSR